MKITRSDLKRLIKEELDAMGLEDETLDEASGEMLVALSKVMQQHGLSLHNGHAWIKDGMAKGYVQRKASRMDTDL